MLRTSTQELYFEYVICLSAVPSVGHRWDRQTGLFHYVPSFSDPSVMCSGTKNGPFPLSRLPVPDGTGRRAFFKVLSVCLSDTDGTGRMTIFTVPSVPSCFSETGNYTVGLSYSTSVPLTV